MTSRPLGYKLAFRPRCALHRSSLRPSSSTGPLPATGEARFSVGLL
jgi:hypothetical protein